MPTDSTTDSDWRKGRRRVHFVTGDNTRVGDTADGSGDVSPVVDERRRRWLLQDIYASAAGDKKRTADLAKAGFPPTLKEALTDERLAVKMPRWRHTLPAPGDLPGEVAPLVHEPRRRRPISPDEALGILRRKRRREIIEQYASAVGDPVALEALKAAGYPPTAEEALTSPELMIEELPRFDSRKLMINFRFPPQLKALADAAAELAGTNVTAMTELLWWQFLQGAPIGPDDFENRTAEYLQATVGPERDEERKKKEFRPKRR